MPRPPDPKPVRILFLGLPLGALALRRARMPPVGVGLSYAGSPGTRRVRRTLGTEGALVMGWPDLGDREVVRAVSSLRPDAVLSWFWPRKLPSAILSLPPRGAFNLHPSLLPRWRGADPTFWALRNGDETTGVTLHRMVAAYDAGPIVAQREVAISKRDDAWSLADRLKRPGLELLVQCAERLARGEALDGAPQDEARATSAPLPTAEDLAVDWRGRAADVIALVRACGRRRGARALLGEREVEIVDAERWDAPMPRALEPAEALVVAGGLAVRCAEGAVLLRAVRDADGLVHEGRALERLVRR